MKINIKLVIFISIIVIAAFLRLFQLGQIPASPNWDEVSLGYNAYSILETGKDEYGEFLPLVMRSYDDYKPALYSYFIIPLLPLFDLSVVAVRLPSALMGITSVIAFYFIVKEAFSYSRELEKKKYFSPSVIALVASFLLAISPWHIQFSRIAFESNVGLGLNLLSVLFFIKGVKNPKLLVLAFMFGALNIHMYQSNRVFTPLLLGALSLIFYKQLLKVKKWYVIGGLVAIIVALPFVIYTVTNNNALLRAKGVSIFSEQSLVKRSAEKLTYDTASGNTFGLLIDNRRVEFVKAVVAGYVSHYDLNWLFISGDIARHHAPFMGLLYLFELPFVLVGVYQLLFGTFDKKTKLIFWAIFLLAPVPAMITSGVPHAVRTLNIMPVFHLFTALGVITGFAFLSKQSYVLRYAAYVVVVVVFAINFSYYLNQYFVQLNYYTARDWLFGYRETVAFSQNKLGDYDSVIVSNLAPLDQSYMFFLFYLKYSPESYLRNGGTSSGGFREEHKGFENIAFRPINWEIDRNLDNALLISNPADFPDTIRAVKTVYYPDGEKAFLIVESEK